MDIVLDSDSCTAVPISVPGLRVACPHLLGRARMKVYRMDTRRMSVVFPQNSHFQNWRISTMRTLELPAQQHVLSAPRAQCLAVGDCNLLAPEVGPRDQGRCQNSRLGKHRSTEVGTASRSREVVDSGQPLQCNDAIQRMPSFWIQIFTQRIAHRKQDIRAN